VERSAWLREVRRATERRFDLDYAPTYDIDDAPMTATHRRFVELVVAATPASGTVLDVPCGTGKYFGLVLGAGRRVHGIDQSAGMLAVAAAKHPLATLEQGGLQELTLAAPADGVLCIDSLENVPPEEWPLVLDRLRGAFAPGGLVYLTVEEIDRREVELAFARARADGLPVVMGEHTVRGGGYHFYPTREAVRARLADAGLVVVDDATTTADSYGYWHLLTTSASGGPRLSRSEVRAESAMRRD
jgi:SAM-dependent methyltransferase